MQGWRTIHDRPRFRMHLYNVAVQYMTNLVSDAFVQCRSTIHDRPRCRMHLYNVAVQYMTDRICSDAFVQCCGTIHDRAPRLKGPRSDGAYMFCTVPCAQACGCEDLLSRASHAGRRRPHTILA